MITCNCGKPIPTQEVACSPECRERVHQQPTPPQEDSRWIGANQHPGFGRVAWAWMTRDQREAVLAKLKRS